MNPSEQEWSVLSSKLDEALELPESARLAWVDSLTDISGELKATLRRLIEKGVDRRFLAALPAVGEPPPEAVPGGARQVGPYNLLRELGSGGMGSVWLAERSDGLLKRPVALKLPHAGQPDLTFLERFGRERDILASLTHPNIARLYDAGLAGGEEFLMATKPVPYYLRVTNLARSQCVKPMRLQAALRVFERPLEPDDTPELAKPVAFGQTLSANLFPNGDEDWRLVSVPSAGRLSLRVTDPPDNIDPIVHVRRKTTIEKPLRVLYLEGDPSNAIDASRFDGVSISRIDAWEPKANGALDRLGVPDSEVQGAGPGACTRWSSLVCFGGVGAGEVTVAARKVVGLAQRRNRSGAWFHGACVLRWDPTLLLEVLDLSPGERAAAAVGLGAAATGVADALVGDPSLGGRAIPDRDDVASALLDALP